MRVTVTGTGYVGLVSAAVFAKMGHDVIGLDVDVAKVRLLNEGVPPFHEEGLEELLAENKERLKFTSDLEQAYRDAEVIFIAVPTPEKADGSANLRYVHEAAEQIAHSVQNDTVVVIKSTVPMGTNGKIQKQFDSILDSSSKKIEVVSNPEFLSQGTAVKNMLYPDRIVVGTKSKSSEAVMKRFYESVSCPVLYMGLESAEMVKYASNDYLALKISYINEIANLCELLGANIEEVAQGMGMDDRIGAKFLNAGIGYGGSCFPKDTKALHWLSNYHDKELRTVKAAIEVNSQQNLMLLKKAKKYLDSFEGLTVAVLGLSFKPGTDDLREAPSIKNINILLDSGANVKAWDPLSMEKYKALHPEHDIEYCDSIETTIAGADLCLIMTEWPEVMNMDVSLFKSMRRSLVLDGRNCFSLESMSDQKIEYESIGRAAREQV